MSFQPSSANDAGNGGSMPSILLAAARGTVTLMYDCSGRVLSPLLGRLDAQLSNDPWGIGRVVVSGSGSFGKGGEGIVSSTVHDGFDHHLTNNANNVLSSSSGIDIYSNEAVVAPPTTATKIPMGWRYDDDNEIVTSMDWKQSVPVLLATCGITACVWDIRASSLRGGGVPPNSRFVLRPDDDEHDDHNVTRCGRRGRSLVHCAYSTNESDHTFGTLDYGGVVRVWDDRCPDRPSCFFIACPGGGVGIASIRSAVGRQPSRWVTWGMDNVYDRNEGDENENDEMIRLQCSTDTNRGKDG